MQESISMLLMWLIGFGACYFYNKANVDKLHKGIKKRDSWIKMLNNHIASCDIRSDNLYHEITLYQDYLMDNYNIYVRIDEDGTAHTSVLENEFKSLHPATGV